MYPFSRDSTRALFKDARKKSLRFYQNSRKFCFFFFFSSEMSGHGAEGAANIALLRVPGNESLFKKGLQISISLR